ncbi:UNVERIFIED_CONTAM: hypothetical protein Slati_2428300 [Sesamum latifolium]|uniref:CCHC-type domain-containing protein n=1 Tax=Sesamum latifolium TaxID=2727402 RepID=A0AAW2WCU2_9LAMI
MNLGMATFIGNKLGIFQDMEMDELGFAWGASLRIRVGLDVNKPLKRALKIKTTMGEEHMVRFTYERLPSFCYLCGTLGHIATFCEEHFQDGFVDPGENFPYGPWLRKPILVRNRVLQGSLIRNKEDFKPSESRQRHKKKGQAIFRDFISGSNSVTPPISKQQAPNLAREMKTASQEPKRGQTIVRETAPSISHKQKERDRTGGRRLLVDSMLTDKGAEMDGEHLEGDNPNHSPLDLTEQRSLSGDSGQMILTDTNLTDIPLQFAAAGIKLKPTARRGRPRKGRGQLHTTNRKRGPGLFLIESEGHPHGLGSPWTIRQLETWMKQVHPDFVFLSETKCYARRVDKLRGRFGVGVDAVGKSGGLYLFWHQQCTVQLQSFSPSHIDVTVLNSYGDDWRFTGLYGQPEAAKRKDTWDLLQKLSRKSMRLWLVAGDFNEILHQKEKSGMHRRPQWEINDFRRCLNVCNLADIENDATQFTWCNHREEPLTVRAKLDKAVASEAWATLFP